MEVCGHELPDLPEGAIAGKVILAVEVITLAILHAILVSVEDQLLDAAQSEGRTPPPDGDPG